MSALGKSRFVSNSVALMFHTVFAAAVALVQVKVLANTLAQDTFGLFASLRGLSLILAILAANGLPHLLLRYLPVHESRGLRAHALRLGAGCVLGAVVLLFGLIAGLRVLEGHAFAFADVNALGPSLFFWFAVYALATTIKMVVYGGLNGLRRHIIQVLLELVSGGVVLALIVYHRGTLDIVSLIRILGAVNGVAALIGLMIFFGWILGTVKRKERGEAQTNGSRAGEYRSYVLWASALSFVSFSFTDVDRYILAQVLTLEVLALFDVGVRPIRLANRLLCISNVAFQPEVTRWIALGEHDRVDLSARVFFKLNCVFGVVVAVSIVLFARDIVVAIASPEYAAAAPILMVLAVCLPLSTMTVPLTAVMKASNRIRDALAADGVWAVTYVGLLFALGAWFGLMGVALAQVVSCLTQLLTAIRRSTLSIDIRMASLLCARLLAVASVAYAPAVAFIVIPGIDPGGAASVVARGVLFLIGSAVVPMGIHRVRVFSPEERTVLAAVVSQRAPWLTRFVGQP